MLPGRRIEKCKWSLTIPPNAIDQSRRYSNEASCDEKIGGEISIILPQSADFSYAKYQVVWATPIEVFTVMLPPLHVFGLLGKFIADGTIATKSGSVIKTAKCELCGNEYNYRLTRTAHARAINWFGSTDGDILAAERAQKKLQMALEKGIDPVPCHRCGWFQRDMVFQARKLRHRWMKIAGVVCFFVAILMYVLAGISFRLENGVSFFTIFFAVLGGLAALSVPVLPLLKYLLCHKYDPNYDTALAQLRNIPKTPPQIIILNWNNKTSKPFEDEASNPRTTEKNPSFSGENRNSSNWRGDFYALSEKVKSVLWILFAICVVGVLVAVAVAVVWKLVVPAEIPDLRSAIERAGGFVRVDKSSPGEPIVAIDFRGLHFQQTIGYFNRYPGDHDLKEARPYLESLPELRTLEISTAPGVSDDGLTHLESLHQVKNIIITNTVESGISQNGLERLTKKLPNAKVEVIFRFPLLR